MEINFNNFPNLKANVHLYAIHMATVLLQDETSGAPHDYHGHSRCFQKAVLMSRLLVRLCSPGEQGPVHSAVVRRAAQQRRQRRWQWWLEPLVLLHSAAACRLCSAELTHPGACRAYGFSLFCFCYHVFSRASQVHSQHSQQPQSPGHAQACNP